MLKLVLLYVHLIAFAAYAGSAVTAGALLRGSLRSGLASNVRDAWESAAATTIARIELPMAFLLVLTGAGLILSTPGFLHAAWLHIKLTLVFLLLVLTHLKMFNAKAIVRARAGGGNDASLLARKRRQALYGPASLLFGLLVVALAVFKPFSLR